LTCDHSWRFPLLGYDTSMGNWFHYSVTWYHIPEWKPQLHHCENLKTCIISGLYYVMFKLNMVVFH
jgi:hypothetical protein